MKEIKSWFVENKKTIISVVCMVGSFGLSILQNIKQKDEIRDAVNSYYTEMIEVGNEEETEEGSESE